VIELIGIPVAEGIVTGKTLLMGKGRLRVKKYNISEEKITEEIIKLQKAVVNTQSYMKNIKNLSYKDLGGNISYIFDVYLLLLEDKQFVGKIEESIKNDLINAEYAVKKVSQTILKSFDNIENAYFKERKHDIEYVVNRLILEMDGTNTDYTDHIASDSIVIAQDISPSEMSILYNKNIKGFATEKGSKISHTSILARSFGTPSVAGLRNLMEKVENGETVIIDGFDGKVIMEPTEEIISHYREKEKRYNNYTKELDKLKNFEAKTLDGTVIKLYANVELNEEISISNEYSASGIGLYRTEFMYLKKGDLSEDEQFDILKEAVIKNKDKPFIIRTFDLGGEKLSDILPHPTEENPAMGLRAIRYCLKYEHFFKKQIKAILRAAFYGDVRLMLPLISGVEEIRQAKSMISSAQSDLEIEGKEFKKNIPVGIMVELPSIALIAHLIAKEVDFFSIGTNDLIQYALGFDRTNEHVAYLYRPTHPAFLMLLSKILRNADMHKIEAIVCGEIAGVPKYIPLLLGLGYRHLSMSPSLLLKAKMVIKRLNIADCERIVRVLKRCKIARRSEDTLEKFIEAYTTDIYFRS